MYLLLRIPFLICMHSDYRGRSEALLRLDSPTTENRKTDLIYVAHFALSSPFPWPHCYLLESFEAWKENEYRLAFFRRTRKNPSLPCWKLYLNGIDRPLLITLLLVKWLFMLCPLTPFIHPYYCYDQDRIVWHWHSNRLFKEGSFIDAFEKNTLERI